MKLSIWLVTHRYTTPEDRMSYFASNLPVAGVTADSEVYRVEVEVPDRAPSLMGTVVSPASPQDNAEKETP